jgi:NAD(P)-dependent dehydrogenase (short-subunit alcohol dehydrogenase family)
VESIKDRVAFVTGAASGIGLGITRALVDAGARVMMADIEAPALAAAASELAIDGGQDGGEIDTVVCDVSDRDSVFAAAEATLAAFGRVHLVCNNAGVSTGGLIEDCDEGDWGWSVGVNYLGVVHGCQAFVPHIKRQGEGGHIVNTSSMAGLLGGMPGWGPYNSTKFAVVGLTEVLRQEGRTGGFGASVLCPGGVRTNIYDAPRNRPGRFGKQVSKVAFEDISEGIAQGLDPDIVGRLVVEGVLANRLYIFTDPRFRKLLNKRFARIIEDVDWAAASDSLGSAGAPGARQGD